MPTKTSLFSGGAALQFDAAAATRSLSKADPVMKQLIRRVGPFLLRRRLQRTPFEALAESIVYQQLNGRAAATIHGRVLALFPRKKMMPSLLLSRSDVELRAAGLSRNKLLALRDLAQKATEGLVPTWRKLDAMGDEEIIEQLVQVRGIGRWTVQMLLIFRMGRADVLPVDDFAVRKAFGLLYGVRGEVDKKRLENHAEQWRPFRTAASWYLWRSLDTVTPDT